MSDMFLLASNVFYTALYLGKPNNQPTAEKMHPLCLRHLPRRGRGPTDQILEKAFDFHTA